MNTPRQSVYTYNYPRPAVTVDALVPWKDPDGSTSFILLVKRAHPPCQGCWALPGGFLEIDEDLPDALRRELKEETGIKAVRMHQLGTYGNPQRDPRGRVISVVYRVSEYEASACCAGDDARALDWWPINRLPPLAFDHQRIVEDALSAELSE